MLKTAFTTSLLIFCSIGTINSISLTEVLDVFTVAKDVAINLAKTWNLVNDFTHENYDAPAFLESREKKLLNRMNTVNSRLQELSKRFDAVGSQTMNVILRNLPARIRLELKLNDFRDYVTRIDVAHRRMENYANNSEEIEKHTLEDFAKNVVSHDSSSVLSLLERIFSFVVPPMSIGVPDSGILGSIESFMKVMYFVGF